MALPLDIVSTLGPEWSVPIFLLWLLWELYCPFPSHTTKIQAFHADLTNRLERIEVTQIAMAEEIEYIDESEVRKIHGEEGLTVSDVKDGR